MRSSFPFLLLLVLPCAAWAEVVEPDELPTVKPPKPAPVAPAENFAQPLPVAPPVVKPAPVVKAETEPAPVPPGPNTLNVDEPGFKATVKFVQPAPPKEPVAGPDGSAPKQFLRRTAWSTPVEIDSNGEPILIQTPDGGTVHAVQEDVISPEMEAMIAREKGRKPRDIAKMYSTLIAQDVNNAEAHYRQGLALLKDNDVTNGTVALSMALQLSPGNPRYQCDYGLALLRSGDASKALIACQSAAVAAPAVARYQSALGDCFLTLGRGVEAADSYKRAISIDSRNPNYVFNYGLSLMNQKLFKKAIDAFDEAIRINPNNPQFHCSRGVALENTRKIREAMGCYQRAIALDKNFARAHHLLAGTYSDPNDPTYTSSIEAIQHATTAVKLTNWKNAEYLIGLARALRVAHNLDEAVEVAKKAVALEPREEFRRELAALEKAQNEGGFDLTK